MEGDNKRSRGQEVWLRVSTAVFQGPEEQAGQQGLTMRTHYTQAKHGEMNGSGDGQEGLVRRLSRYSRQ